MRSNVLSHIDFERVNTLLEGFNQSTGFVTAILDLEGNILSQSGWRSICTEFHRVHPASMLNCKESDTILANEMKAGEKYHFYQCRNGLIDVAVPIVIRGEHVANLFSGQFFFEAPDIFFFRDQAARFGFDEITYLKALEKVPVVSKDQVIKSMDFLVNITQMIAEMTLEKLEQIELNEAVKRSEAALMASQIQLKQNMNDLLATQKIAHVGTWRLDVDTNQVTWSEELYKMYGFDPTVPPPPYTEHMKLFTPASWKALSVSLERTSTTGVPYELELETVTADGSNGWMWVRGEASTDENGHIDSLWGAAQDITERKLLEIQLKESEERFQLLFDKAPLGYQSLDIDGRFIEVNQKWLDIFGYEKNEVVGKWFGDFLAPDYQEAFKKRFPVFKKQGHIQSQFEMVKKNGEKLFIAFDGKIAYAHDGEFQQTHCILKDITIERELSAQLAKNRELMESILENTTDAVYIKDCGGKYVLVNKAVEQVVGKDRNELLGHDDHTLFPSAEAEIIMAADRSVMQGGVATTFEETATAANGSRHYYSSTKGPIFDENKNIAGIFGIARDITETKELELRVEKERMLLQATLTSVGDGVITSDIQGNVQFLNPVAERLTGWTQSEAFGKPFEEVFEIVSESTGERSTNIVNLVLETGNIVGLANHTALVGRNGERRPIEDTAAPIVMENGEITGVVVVFSDFTDKRKRLEEIEYLSYHDFLTGLYNRRFFEEELRRHDVSRNLPISIVMGDVNGLKLVNDSFGHPVGDEILKKVAEHLAKACRTDDVVARLGGDEFVVLLPKAGIEDTERLIMRIQSELSKDNISGIPLSISFGQSTKTSGEQSMLEMLKDAEDHMYRHKLYESAGARSKTVDLIINTLYAKNHREMLHSKRVSQLAEMVASSMGCPLDDVNQIKTAGLLHDIGKIGVDDSILNKTGRLDHQEWEKIRKHSEIGYHILSSVPEFSEIANFVLEHQERWDGSGYPRGLKGDQISIEARIIAVADSYDAMTGLRSYGSQMSEEEACGELLRCAGTQFDPEIVERFIQAIGTNK